jgi:hypothetical protein
MNLSRYQEWLKNPRFSEFYIHDNGIMCSVCSLHLKKRFKSKPYVNVPAKPQFNSSLEKHLYSQLHKNSILTKNSLLKRKYNVIKKNEINKKKNY